MSLDVWLSVPLPIPVDQIREGKVEREWEEVFSANITHNLGKMAGEAGIYKACWRPEEVGICTASDLIEPLTEGLALLKSDPERFKAFNSPNGWGMYKHFVPWVERYLEAAIENPDAEIGVSR